MFEHRYRQLVRTSAIYDLVATAAFATPWTFQLVHQTLGLISPLPDFKPLHGFFANLLGSIVVVWSILRISGIRLLAVAQNTLRHAYPLPDF